MKLKASILSVVMITFVLFTSDLAQGQKFDETIFASANFRYEETVYVPTEKSAEFPGGIDKFYCYLYKNLNPPGKSKRKAKTGKIFVEFTINPNGSIEDEAVRVLSPQELGVTSEEIISDIDYEKEAIRVIKECPNWTPALQDSHAIKQRMVLPIVYR